MLKLLFVASITTSILLVQIGCDRAEPETADRDTTVDAAANQMVPERAEDVKPLQAGVVAPSLSLRTPEGALVALDTIYRDQPTVLLFYRGGWCPFCNVHLKEVAEAEGQLRQLGFQIIGISPDRPEKLRESIQEQELNYSLLSDSEMELARAFGLAFKVDQEAYEHLAGHGIDLEEASGRAHHLLPVPAVYLIDQEGMIRFAYWDTDYRQRLSVADLITAAEAIHQE